jgi:hypothetical protein
MQTKNEFPFTRNKISNFKARFDIEEESDWEKDLGIKDPRFQDAKPQFK